MGNGGGGRRSTGHDMKRKAAEPRAPMDVVEKGEAATTSCRVGRQRETLGRRQWSATHAILMSLVFGRGTEGFGSDARGERERRWSGIRFHTEEVVEGRHGGADIKRRWRLWFYSAEGGR
jgi:hypothetical protein